MNTNEWIKKISEIRLQNLPTDGGKNASLGEIYSALPAEGITVPDGFAVTADAYLNVKGEENLILPTEL